jgi:lipopolysaccharide/colanic/teichoic acid biosynthesis glycosyltransferase
MMAGSVPPGELTPAIRTPRADSEAHFVPNERYLDSLELSQHDERLDVGLSAGSTSAVFGVALAVLAPMPLPWPFRLPLALLFALGAAMLGLRFQTRAWRVLRLPGATAGAQLGSAVKRGFDLAAASLMLLAVSPFMALIALCIVVESPGPVFYRGRRVGRRGQPLDILKFRKMRDGVKGRPLTLANDERFTRIGQWLARTKLDELPQLLNVIRGEMSLVGPRPEDPSFVQRHRDAFEPVLRVRPGITGLSQLVFRRESELLDPNDPIGHYERRILPQKLQLDKLYVKRSSLLLDLRIIAWTVAVTMLAVPVSVHRSTARLKARGSGGGRRAGADVTSSRVAEFVTQPLSYAEEFAGTAPELVATTIAER